LAWSREFAFCRKTPVTEDPSKLNGQPDLSVVVVSYNTAHLLKRMFAALDRAKGSLRLQIIVVDNASTDNSVDILEAQYPAVTLIKNSKNVGFGRANNQAISHITGRHTLLLNTDAFVAPETLEKTISFMDSHPRCGIVGVKLVSEDGMLQPSCRYFPTPWNVFLQKTGLARLFPGHRLVDNFSWDHASVRPCDWVPGCFYLVRGKVIEQIGLFDPRFFLYYEEVDHCRAVKTAGWEVIYYPSTEVVHIGGESAKSNSAISKVGRQISPLQIESELLYYRKYFGLSGAIAGVALSTSADLLSALHGLLRRLDLKGASSAFQHISTVMQVFGATGFAAHPTR
jgi:N-acetylglucosaminyl-diphospho-decaprenol L-rhamnosyltransferase